MASEFEMREVLKLGVSPEKCIYANPVKQSDHIKVARELGVKKMTFDSIEELHKIKKEFPQAECILRIAVETTTAMYNLSEKFGAFMEDVPKILQAGKKLGLRLKGVAFHTGSGGVTFESYRSSLVNARTIFDMASGLGLQEMDFLDIGGGFTLICPGTGKNFEEVAPMIGKLIDDVFPEPNIQIIAEPGRYIVESMAFMASRVIG